MIKYTYLLIEKNDDLVQYCGISPINSLEIPQSYTEALIIVINIDPYMYVV